MTRIGRPNLARGKGGQLCVKLTPAGREQLLALVAWFQREIAGADATVSASDVTRFALNFLDENKDLIQRRGA